ncbi:MAG TPA: carboxypeptidase-like regulatory domain-containing protein, partial [Flavisolibacter sp.]|nr:carboxypeptidase-like regulatory domain-containing protein [Flavisolibacter sp.]
IRVTPQVQYDYMQQGVRLFKAEVEKGFSKSNFFNISYEKDILNNISTASAGLRINFSFAQTAVSAMRTNKAVTLIQSATGSLIYDGKTNYTNARNRSSVGRGGIVLIPFLDVNCNGKRDADEPKVPGLKARTNGGFIVSKNDESLIRIVDLEPYTPYLVELDDQKLGNIAWQIKNKTLKIAVDPNQMKLVEIPVAVLGEASGMVYINKGKEQPGIGRIIVAFFDSSSRLVAKTLSEGDGYFSYLGLPPGNYTARIDSAQLQVLNMRVTPEKLSFHIATSNDGVVADGFAFMLQSLTPSKLPIDTGEKQQQQAAIQQETSVNSKNEYAEQERSSEKQLHSIIKGKQSSDQKQSDIRLQSNKLPVSEKKPQIADLEKQSTQPGVSGQVKSQNNEQSIIINSKPVTNKKQQQHLTPDAQKAVDVNKGQMQMKEKEIPISNSLQQLFQRLEQMISEMQESAQKLQKFFMEEEVKKQDED